MRAFVSSLPSVCVAFPATVLTQALSLHFLSLLFPASLFPSYHSPQTREIFKDILMLELQ